MATVLCVGLDWQRDALPVLEATYRELRDQHYRELQFEEIAALAARLGRSDDDMELRRIFEHLARDDYIAATWAGVILPYGLAATPKGLQRFEGWPAPDEIDLAPLIRLLDERIEDPAAPEEEA